MSIDGDELHRRLGYHPAGPATAPMFELNRALALTVADVWVQLLPEGREQSLALTALQEALMWANAAVACNVDPTEGPMPVIDVATHLDDVLERLEGPTMRRSGPLAPPAGPDRPPLPFSYSTVPLADRLTPLAAREGDELAQRRRQVETCGRETFHTGTGLAGRCTREPDHDGDCAAGGHW